MSAAVQGCEKGSPFVLIPLWPEVAVSEVTPSLGFYGLRDTAWAGRIRVQSRAGEWLIRSQTEGASECVRSHKEVHVDETTRFLADRSSDCYGHQ